MRKIGSFQEAKVLLQNGSHFYMVNNQIKIRIYYKKGSYSLKGDNFSVSLNEEDLNTLYPLAIYYLIEDNDEVTIDEHIDEQYYRWHH